MQLWEYWGYCGDIESLDMMTFPDTGRFRGIVFITFKTVRWRCSLRCAVAASCACQSRVMGAGQQQLLSTSQFA